MVNAVFWVVTACGFVKTELLLALLLAPTDFFTLMMQSISSSETLVLTKATRHHIPEEGIFHSYRRKNFKSYIAIFCLMLLPLEFTIK
jgi:hypothetical protein